MRKIILLSLIILMMVGCVNQEGEAPYVGKDAFATIEYDSCEYLLRISHYQGYLAHKGNCRFCKERRQKELKELIEQLKGN